MQSRADRPWTPGPAHPELAAGATHVWLADLDVVGEQVGGLLCAQESARARRLLSKRDRRRWTRSRGVLRALLGNYLQRHPSTLRFVLSPNGKPELSGAGLSFNLSHSGALALFAFTEAGAVGVDVEVARRPLDEVALATRLLGPAEGRRLEGVAPGAREGEFLRIWTRHEAGLKCRGTGIGRAIASPPDTAPELWVAGLDVGPRAAGAVALERAPSELCCWELPGIGDLLGAEARIAPG